MESKPAKSVSYTSSVYMAGIRNAHDVLKNDARNDMVEQVHDNFCVVGDRQCCIPSPRRCGDDRGDTRRASEPRWWR